MKFANFLLLARVFLIGILHWYMKEKSNFNVKIMITNVVRRVKKLEILPQFMKEINPFNLEFVLFKTFIAEKAHCISS